MDKKNKKKQFKLATQFPKPKILGIGVLSIDAKGDAYFFENMGEGTAQILAKMVRTKINFAGADGMMFSGFEPTGFTRSGLTKYSYQEWWLIYI